MSPPSPLPPFQLLHGDSQAGTRPFFSFDTTPWGSEPGGPSLSDVWHNRLDPWLAEQEQFACMGAEAAAGGLQMDAMMLDLFCDDPPPPLR